MRKSIANQKVTIREVAIHAGVSQSTVSRVVNNCPTVNAELRKVVMASVDELNYRPSYISKALATRRSFTIGMVVRSYFGNYISQLMDSTERELSKQGIQLMLANGQGEREAERKAVDSFIARGCDALILHADGLTDEEILEINTQGTPIINMQRVVPGLEAQTISVDCVQGTYLAVRHLLELDHKHIAFVHGPTDKVEVQHRIRGYKKALREFGIEFKQRLLIECGYAPQACEIVTKKLIKQGPNFTAIVFYNDEMAFAGMHVLEQHRISIPGKVSVVGFDDVHQASYQKPALTTVRTDIADMGVTVAHLASALAGGETPVAFDQVHDAKLIVRGSTAKPVESRKIANFFSR